MLRAFFAMSIAGLVAIPIALAAAHELSPGSGPFFETSPDGDNQILSSISDTGQDGTLATIVCGASRAHYRLCSDIKATCDSIHVTVPSHACGCITDNNGNLTRCDTGYDDAAVFPDTAFPGTEVSKTHR